MAATCAAAFAGARFMKWPAAWGQRHRLGHTADDFCEAFLRNALFTDG